MAGSATISPEETIDRLAEWLAKRLSVDKVTVTGVERPNQGFSNETVLFDAGWSVGGHARTERLVARIAPKKHQLFLDADLMLQWKMMDAVGRASEIPVPPLLFSEEDRSVLGAPFFVMGRVEGRVPNDIPSYHAEGWMVEDLTPPERAHLWTGGLDALATLHQLDWRDGFTFLEDPRRGATGLDHYLDWVADWYSWAAQGRVQPTTDVAMRYLLDERPPDAPVEVLWGDARIGNMVFSSDVDVAAVLDWEMAALGPGEVDLGWWLFMDRLYSEGFGVPRLEGLPDQGSTVSHYEERRGREVSNLDYYLVLAGLRMAVVLTRTADLQVEYGILPATTTFGTHNPATRILAELLDLPVPDLSPDFGAAADAARAGTKE